MNVIRIHTNSSADLGAILNKYIAALPDINDGHSTGCTTTFAVGHCQRGQHQLSIKTPVVWGRDKQVHICGTGPNGIELINDTGQDDYFRVIGGGVGQNAHFSAFTAVGGGIRAEGRVRGSFRVREVKFSETPSAAIKAVDGDFQLGDADDTELGPTRYLFEECYFDLCNGSFLLEGSTFAVGDIVGGESTNNKKSPLIANSIGIKVDSHDFQTCDDVAYIQMTGINERSITQHIKHCRFGGENSGSTGIPQADILLEEQAGNTVGRIDFEANHFNGSAATTTGSKRNALRFKTRPNDIHVYDNNFAGTYTDGIVGEEWTNGLNPLTSPDVNKRLRNYWGRNRITGTTANVNVFENGGVGWDMPLIDSDFTGHLDEQSRRRWVAPNGQHFLESIDNTGNRAIVPVPYV